MTILRTVGAICVLSICVNLFGSAQLSFEGQYADILFGNIDQAYVAPRAPKVIQLLDSTHAVLSGCDDGVTWWGNILANITNNGRTMYVDFSPKGGPSSVEANLTDGGHITWSGDNFWERTSYASSFQGDFTSVFRGSALPNFPAAEQSVSIDVSPLTGPNYYVTTATISSSAWAAGTTATASIRYNVLTADFSAVGGPSGLLANLTKSGDVQWLDAENMWQRELCTASAAASSSSGDDKIFTQNIVLSVISFVVMVLSLVGGVGYLWYSKFSKPSEPLLVK